MNKTKKLKVVRIIDYVVPMYGNIHCMPYFTLEVTDGEKTQICKSKGDKWNDCNAEGQYITFNRKRYKVLNIGTLYSPIIDIRNY